MKMPYHGRYVFVVLICAILGVAIVVQMVRINYTTYSQQLIAKSADYQGVEKIIYPSRGTIYDRSGHILATNQVGYELGIDLKFVNDPESIAFSVASIIDDLDYVNVFELASTEERENENRYFVLSSYVSKEKIDELSRLKESYADRRQQQRAEKPSLSGLVWYPMQQRTYPEGTLAANLLGFYNYFSRETAQGVYGVEEAYNRLLTGKPQSVFMPNDPYLVEALPDIQAGASLVLTIDRDIQRMVERQLADAMEWSGAEGGTIIVPRRGQNTCPPAIIFSQ